MDNRCSLNPAGARRGSELHTQKSRIGSTKDRSTQMGQPPSRIGGARDARAALASIHGDQLQGSITCSRHAVRQNEHQVLALHAAAEGKGV